MLGTVTEQSRGSLVMRRSSFHGGNQAFYLPQVWDFPQETGHHELLFTTSRTAQ